MLSNDGAGKRLSARSIIVRMGWVRSCATRALPVLVHPPGWRSFDGAEVAAALFVKQLWLPPARARSAILLPLTRLPVTVLPTALHGLCLPSGRGRGSIGIQYSVGNSAMP